MAKPTIKPTIKYAFAAPRRERRKASRTLARRFVQYNGLRPRYVPASNPTCPTHHRKLPCTRCGA